LIRKPINKTCEGLISDNTHAMTQIGVSVEVSFQVQPLQKRIIRATQELIEDVEVSLVVVLVHDTRLLKQIVQDIAAIRNSLPKT
jgi:hypothetical protein